MYFPSRDKFGEPKQIGLEHEDIFFKDESGKNIHGWWLPAKTKKVKGTFVYFHGNAQNLTSHFYSMSWLPEAGYNYFIFDYPGYGQSEGAPSPKDNVVSGIAAVEWVRKNKDQNPLIIYGQSMGGAVALRVAVEIKDRIPMKAVISDGGFYSFRKIARHKMSLSWVTWILQPIGYLVMNDSYAVKSRISEISPTPLLLIHGQKDVVVEPRWSEEMIKMAQDPKELWRIPEGNHGDSFWGVNLKYRQQLLDYLENLK